MNNTEVVFENIEQRILQEISEAHYAIFVSVAWFTNKRLFNTLLDKAKNNCYVSIIIQLDEINSQSGIDYNQIKIGRSECFFISKESELLHDKFCVIDFKKVITGSYNWTYKASHNSENVIILSDPTISSQYITRFEQLKEKYKNSNNSITDSSSNISRGNNISFIEKPKVIIKPAGLPPVLPPPQPTKKECKQCRELIYSNQNFCTYCGLAQTTKSITRIVSCNVCHRNQIEPFIDGLKTKKCIYCGSSNLKFKLINN